ESATISEVSVQLAVNAEKDVPLLAPVICKIPGRIVNKAHPDIAKLARSPSGDTALTFVGRGLNVLPIRGAERYTLHAHAGMTLTLDGARAADLALQQQHAVDERFCR